MVFKRSIEKLKKTPSEKAPFFLFFFLEKQKKRTRSIKAKGQRFFNDVLIYWSIIAFLYLNIEQGTAKWFEIGDWRLENKEYRTGNYEMIWDWRFEIWDWRMRNIEQGTTKWFEIGDWRFEIEEWGIANRELRNDLRIEIGDWRFEIAEQGISNREFWISKCSTYLNY